MTITDQSRANLFERVRNIILRPNAEWDRIDVEPATVQGLYTGYVCILAAIGPICHAIRAIVFGYGAWGLVVYRPSILSVVVNAVVTYLLALAAVFVLALVIDALAPSFGGQKSRIQAFKVAAYASTASWVAGVFKILPVIEILSIVGVYSLYLLYLGIPKLMKTGQDKALPYTVVAILAAIIIYVIVAFVAAATTFVGGGLPGRYGPI